MLNGVFNIYVFGIYLYVCVYIYIYIDVSVCVFICMYKCIHVHMYGCYMYVPVCASTSIHVRAHARMHICM